MGILKMKTYEKVDFAVTYEGRTQLEQWGNQPYNEYTIELTTDGRTADFPFYTGLGWGRQPNIKDVLNSLVLDYIYYSTLSELVDELGYTHEKAKTIFNDIEINNEKLERLFSKHEIEELQSELKDY